VERNSAAAGQALPTNRRPVCDPDCYTTGKLSEHINPPNTTRCCAISAMWSTVPAPQRLQCSATRTSISAPAVHVAAAAPAGLHAVLLRCRRRIPAMDSVHGRRGGRIGSQDAKGALHLTM